jgi:hypothetical protein
LAIFQENPSSDSFYDSDNAEQEGAQQSKEVVDTHEPYTRQSIHESSEFEEDDDIEPERLAMEQMSSAAWDDPTQIDWGHEKEEPAVAASSVQPTAAAPATSASQTFKCTALYSYTVSIF